MVSKEVKNTLHSMIYAYDSIYFDYQHNKNMALKGIYNY